MKLRAIKLFFLVTILMLASCSKVPDIALTPELTIFYSDDSEKRVTLTQEDEAYQELDDWLRDNQSDWISTSGHFPSGIYIVSGDYGIQITKLHVVLYLSNRKNTKASFIQNLGANELRKIRDADQSAKK